MIDPNLPNEVAASYEELLAEYSARYQKQVAEFEAEIAALRDKVKAIGHSGNCASKKCVICTSVGYDAWQEMEWCGIRHKFRPSDCSNDCPQHPDWISPSKFHAELERNHDNV